MGIPVTVPVVQSLTPVSGPVDTEVTITGSGFTGATAVTFNGTPAPNRFTVVSASEISASVPLDASTGPVEVTGPGGTSPATETFTVTPAIVVWPPNTPPTTNIFVEGFGFGDSKAVNIDLDATQVAQATTRSTGEFI